MGKSDEAPTNKMCHRAPLSGGKGRAYPKFRGKDHSLMGGTRSLFPFNRGERSLH